MLACFHTDNGLVACRNPDLLQRAFDALTALFVRVGLRTNTKKMETITFLPGKIHNHLTEERYRTSRDNHFQKRLKGRRVNCNLCNADLAVGLVQSHFETQHDVFPLLCRCKRAGNEVREPVTYAAWYSIMNQKFS